MTTFIQIDHPDEETPDLVNLDHIITVYKGNQPPRLRATVTGYDHDITLDAPPAGKVRNHVSVGSWFAQLKRIEIR